LSAGGSASFLVPVVAGGISSADGVINYDSTGKITHIRTNGADSDAAATTSTSTTTTQALFATLVAGIYNPRAIAIGDLPTSLVYTTNKSDVINQSTSQGTVVLSTSPATGLYRVHYYSDLNTPCTTGANAVSFTFNWTDAGNARSLTTGNLSLGAAQNTGEYLEGVFDVWVASGNVTYTSAVIGSCATGTSSYDIHARLEITP
jgi:hypothetical protein